LDQVSKLFCLLIPEQGRRNLKVAELSNRAPANVEERKINVTEHGVHDGRAERDDR
jgi:hypothetical protein